VPPTLTVDRDESHRPRLSWRLLTYSAATPATPTAPATATPTTPATATPTTPATATPTTPAAATPATATPCIALLTNLEDIRDLHVHPCFLLMNFSSKEDAQRALR
jgi:hypothetical protein